MWKIACGAVFIALVSVTQAVPACEGGCVEAEGAQYCDSTCYTKEDNTLYTISKNYATKVPKCKEGTGVCPDDVTDFNFDECQAQCTGDESCGAYIKDTDLAGDRCTFLTACLSAGDAGVLVPCDDCSSQRTCSSCPGFDYLPGSTMVHWLCEMQGDAYAENIKPAEGTKCVPTAQCAKLDEENPKPSSIICGADGDWKDETTGEVVNGDVLVDLPCSCTNLRIPEATDTNVFCKEANAPVGGSYTIESGDECEMVCDGSVFIPLECRFSEDKSAASWHIQFDGEDVNLGANADCLACSIDSCKETPGSTTAGPTTTSATPATTSSTEGFRA